MIEEQITEDELVYHQRVLATLRDAEAAWRSWGAHLAAKYRLGQRDSITESGLIVRQPTEPE